MKKVIYFLIGIVVLALIAGAVVFMLQRSNSSANQMAKPGARIGLSLDSLREDRWKTDKANLEKRATELGATVVTLVANGNDDIQVSQIDNLTAQKVDVLLVVAHNAEAVAAAVKRAQAAGIKVIAYDRMIQNSTPDLYISFDNEKVGELEAQGVLNKVNHGNFAYVGGSPTDNNATLVKQGSMKILEPYIKNGSIKLVFDQFTKDWSPNVAYANIKELLASGKSVDAVVAANDGTAYGVILALTEKGLAGKVPVSGQDAELAALRRIKDGTQTVTVYKPIKALADKTIELAIAIINGKSVQTNAKVNNGTADISSYLLTPVLVDINNMQSTVIKDGFHTYDEIYSK